MLNEEDLIAAWEKRAELGDEYYEILWQYYVDTGRLSGDKRRDSLMGLYYSGFVPKSKLTDVRKELGIPPAEEMM